MFVDRFTWERAVRCRLCTPDIPDEIRPYMLYEGTYANADGTRIRPGEKRAAFDLGCTTRTINRYCAFSVATGFLVQTHRGGKLRGHSEYRTALPVPVCPGHRDVYGHPPDPERAPVEPVNTTPGCHVGLEVEGLQEIVDLVQPDVPDMVNPTSGEVNTTPGCRTTMPLDHEEQKPPPPAKVTDHAVPDQGGGGGGSQPQLEGEGELPAPSPEPAMRPSSAAAPPDTPTATPDPEPNAPPATTATPPTPEHWDAAFDVLAFVAGAWTRPRLALAHLAPDVRTALGTWQPDLLGYHLAHNPPADGIDDAAGLLRYRLGRLPASPGECGRKCCAGRRHDPPRPATCNTHEVEIRDGVCVYCEIAVEAARRIAEQAARQLQHETDEANRCADEIIATLDQHTIHTVTRGAGPDRAIGRARLRNWIKDGRPELAAANGP